MDIAASTLGILIFLGLVYFAYVKVTGKNPVLDYIKERIGPGNM